MGQPEASSRYYRFGVFELDLRTGELHRNGQKVPLQEKPFQVLALLVENAPELVELKRFEGLWGDVNVAFDENLRTAVRKIREALGDNAGVPRYVENLRGRGYRFIYPVEKIPREPIIVRIIHRLRSIRRPLFLSFGFCILLAAIYIVITRVLVEDRIVAVLPFASDGSDQNAKAFGQGLAENAAVELVQFTPRRKWWLRRTVAVVPMREVLEHRITTPKEAYGALRADRVVDGKIDHTAGVARLLFNVTLEPKDRVVCAGTISDVADPLGIAQRIAVEVAKCLDLKPVSRPSGDRAARGAYKAYIEGRGYLDGYDIPDSLERAIKSFSQAVSLDPNFAKAYAGLGAAYWKRYEIEKNPEWEGLAHQSCDQAKDLDDKLAEAHACLGLLRYGSGDYADATVEFQQAVRFDRRMDEAWLGLARANAESGNLPEAEKAYKTAIEVRPYWTNYAALGEFYFYHARYAEAESNLQTAIQKWPDNSELYTELAGFYIAMGRYQDAIKECNESLSRRKTLGAYDNLGTAYLSLGRFDDAISAYQHALDLERHDFRGYGNLARAVYWAGGRERAIHLYEQAVGLAEEQLNVNPRDGNVHVDLAWYFAMLDKQPEALNHLVSAQALESGKAEFAFIAAIVHNQFRDRGKALVCLRRARELGYSTNEIRAAPELKNLHSDPEFQAVVAQGK